MEIDANVITINGVEYVQRDAVSTQAETVDGMPYVIVRTYSAGVFAGYLKSRNGQEGIILKSRRIWYWDGASSLSQLAMEGTQKPENCKFPCEVEKTTLTQIIEILECTEKSRLSIKNVKIWKQ